MVENVQCPVCTLFLHAGMSLSDHLETHPKEQVIKALVQMTITGGKAAAVDNVLKAELLGGGGDTTVKHEHNTSQPSPTTTTTSTEQNRLTSSSASASSLVEINKTENEISRSNSRLSTISNASSVVSASSRCSTATNSSFNFSNSLIMQEQSSPLDLVPQNAENACNASDDFLLRKSNSKQSAAYQTRNNAAAENQISTMSEAFNAMQFSRFQQLQQQKQQRPEHNQQMRMQQQQQQQLQSSNQSQFKLLQQQQQHKLQQNNVATLSKQSNFGQSLLQQHQLPPPPPPPPMPIQQPQAQQQQHQQSKHHSVPLEITGSLYASNQQQGLAYATENQRQQHHHLQPLPQQCQKILFSNGANSLPPPPPLQLFSYQHSMHQHQKPPPAYGTAISQIRSQQNKQNSSSAISNANNFPHHPQQQQQQPHPISLHRYTNASSSQLSAVTGTTTTTTPKSSSTTTTSSSSAVSTPTTSKSTDFIQSNNNKERENEQQQQHVQLPPPPPLPLMQVPIPAASQQQKAANVSLPTYHPPPAAAVNHHHHNLHRQTNSPAASSSSSSVLRFAESPVAHYLERDNGDFIVQETPKHIVECVEEDDGKFSVIERFHQSPPSVLHIHEENDNDGEEGEDEHENETKIGLENENLTQSDENAGSKKSRRSSKDDKPGLTKEKISASSLNTETTTSNQVPSNSNSCSNSTDNSSLKKSTKNTITVLSDVQLNLNEYLDLMGNIIASGKIAKRRMTCSASAPIPLVKIEKIEPPDDEDFEMSLVAATNGKSNDDSKIAKISKISSSQAADSNETDNRVQQHHKQQAQAFALDDTPSCSKNFNNSYKKRNSETESAAKNATTPATQPTQIHLTSVIRMATTTTTTTAKTSSSSSRQEQLKATTTMITTEVDNYLEASPCEKETKTKKDEITHQPTKQEQQKHHQQVYDEQQLLQTTLANETKKEFLNINESMTTAAPQDLSQPQKSAKADVVATAHAITTKPGTSGGSGAFSCGLPPPPPLRKGPKKLVIKPKSTKTEDNAKKSENVCAKETTSSTGSSSSSSTVVPSAVVADVVIKCEPGSYELSCNGAMVAAAAGDVNLAQQRPADFATLANDAKPPPQPPLPPPLEAAVDYSSVKNEKDCYELEKLKSYESLSNVDFSENTTKEDSTAAAADARVLLDFANSTNRATNAATNFLNAAAATSSNNFFSSASYFGNAAQMPTKHDDNDDDDDDNVDDDVNCYRNQHERKQLHEQEFIAVEDLITVSCSPQTTSGVNEGNSNYHELQQQPNQQQQHQQQQQQISQSQNNSTDYPFNFFYGGSQHATKLEDVHHHHQQQQHHQQQHSFSPSMYQQTPDATTTTAATVASSSTLDTLEDSTTSTPNNESNQALQIRFGSVLNHNNNNNATVAQWYQPATLVAHHTDFSAALSLDNAAVDGDADGGKYLDLDACKREVTVSSSGGGVGVVGGGGLQIAPPSSTSSSFAATTTESSLNGGCITAETLNIRTDEKMPPKGEISEQESNCDIENSWSQPAYGENQSKFYRTNWSGIFQHDAAGWNQDEFFTVQDLSSTAANGTTACKNKSFEFHLPMEAAAATSTSFASAVVTLSNDEILPSTSAAAGAKKQKRKRVSDNAALGRPPAVKRAKPTATITSSQQFGQNSNGEVTTNEAENIFQQPAAALTTNTNANGGAAAPAEGAVITNLPARIRRKIYVCPHCNMQFNKLRDKNHHMIEIHSYIRQNRRLISGAVSNATAAVAVAEGDHESAMAAAFSAVYATAVTAAAAAAAASSSTPSANDDGSELLAADEDSKHRIKIKMEYDQPIAQLTQQQVPALIESIDPKTEYIDEKAGLLQMSGEDAFGEATASAIAAAASNSSSIDTKPTLLARQEQQQPLALAPAPTTKLAAVYRMLISFNVTSLKQSVNLTEHDEKLIESSIFFCYTCRTNFSSVKQYDAHLSEHPAECFTCGKKFQRWKNFSLHLKRHLGWKEFGCNICGKKFVVRSALVEHTRMHTGHTPLKCNICGKSFKRYSNLTQHRKRHKRVVVRKKEYVCYCGEVLPSKARFLWHKETHDSKPKCCPHCCDRFIHANSLRRHIRLAHSDKFDYAEPMECPMCKQVFAKSSIKAHMATHSNTQHDCNICNKSFSTKWNLKIHLWVHANRTAKPFKCEHCPKAFVREVDFKNHMNAHKQIKPYTCEYCGCKFIRKYNYMRHRREHHGNKKFTCETCKKSFHRHYYLIEHKRIHTGERPFQCTICGKSSTTKTNHNKHLRIHHSRDPFTVET